VLAYCLMSNHIHLIAVPATDDGFAALAQAAAHALRGMQSGASLHRAARRRIPLVKRRSALHQNARQPAQP